MSKEEILAKLREWRVVCVDAPSKGDKAPFLEILDGLIAGVEQLHTSDEVAEWLLSAGSAATFLRETWCEEKRCNA